jgi:CHAD domain-containing protein
MGRVNREREVKLSAPVGFQMPELSDVGIGLSAVREERLLRTVSWDTPDLRLIRWGCVLRHRDESGSGGTSRTWTVKLANTGEGSLQVRDEHDFEGSPSHPPTAAVDLVRAYVRGAPLAPVVRMRTARRVVSLLAPDGRRLAEVDDDDVTVYEGRRIAGRFRELEVEVIEDCPQTLLETVVGRLRAAGAGDPAGGNKVAQALGARAAVPPEVVVDVLDRSSAAAAVVRRAIASSVARLMRYDPALRVSDDPEDVHQARVATRRLRSDLRTFAPLIEPGWAGELSDELRWLAAELGAVRDAEVLLERLRAATGRLPAEDAPSGMAVASLLEAEVASGRARLLAAIREDRYFALLDRLVEAARSPSLTELAEAPAAEVLPALLAVPWSRLRRDAGRLRPDSPDEELHAARIRAKRCRYAAEAAAPVSGPAYSAFAKTVAGLQEVLGDHQDAVIAARWLRERASSGPHPFAAGQLWAGQQALASESRAAWPAAWAAVKKAAKRILA